MTRFKAFVVVDGSNDHYLKVDRFVPKNLSKLGRDSTTVRCRLIQELNRVHGQTENSVEESRAGSLGTGNPRGCLVVKSQKNLRVQRGAKRHKKKKNFVLDVFWWRHARTEGSLRG